MAKKKLKVDISNTKISEDELAAFASSQFAKVDDFDNGEVVKILSPAYTIKTKFGVKRHIQVKAKKGTLTLRLNKISLTNLVKRLGSDSEKWVGQTATVNKSNILGKDTIILE
jgi:hypothetical protein